MGGDLRREGPWCGEAAPPCQKEPTEAVPHLVGLGLGLGLWRSSEHTQLGVDHIPRIYLENTDVLNSNWPEIYLGGQREMLESVAGMRDFCNNLFSLLLLPQTYPG